MFGFWTHVILVPLCVGLGYLLKYIVDNMQALDAQIKRLRAPEIQRRYEPGPSPGYAPPPAMSEVKLSADPDKLAALKSAIKN
jgi:hypothetical protein